MNADIKSDLPISFFHNPPPAEQALHDEIFRLKQVINHLYGFTETDNRITFYEREYYPFSNFSSFAIEYDGRTWPTSEHAYQAMKFTSYRMQEIIRNQKSAHAAFKLAREWNDQRRLDWEEVKVGVMERVCRAKLYQHPYVQKKLIESGERELVESSPKDSFWGWGPKRDGRNELGKVWMRLRTELNEKRTAGFKTGEQWLKLYNESHPKDQIEIMDPDGWRLNDNVRFTTTLISIEDFNHRLNMCTICGLDNSKKFDRFVEEQSTR